MNLDHIIEMTDDLILALVRSSLRRSVADGLGGSLNEFQIGQYIEQNTPKFAKLINQYMIHEVLWNAEKARILKTNDDGFWSEVI